MAAQPYAISMTDMIIMNRNDKVSRTYHLPTIHDPAEGCLRKFEILGKLKSCRELRDNMLHEDLLSKMRASPPTKGRSVSAHEVVDDGYRSGGSIEHPVLTGKHSQYN